MRLLLIDPDVLAARALQGALERAGYAVEVFIDTGHGTARALAGSFDFVVVVEGPAAPAGAPLSTPTGCATVRALRRAGLAAPLLLLAAPASACDEAAALDAGADDCLRRPAAVPELLARLRALGRIRRDAWSW